MKLTEQRTAIARAIWNIRREDEDRCDIELEDLGHDHSVWREADAAIAALPKPEPVAEIIDAVQTPGYFYVKKLGAYIPQGTKLYTEAPIAPPASEQKPVAYLVSIEGEPELGHWFAETNTAVPGVLYKPLYLAPQPDYKAQRDAGSQAAKDVLAERRRQIYAEGWTPEHDDRHTNGSLARAAATYAAHAAFGDRESRQFYACLWPWDNDWWKPSTPRRDLVKAAALTLAAIESIDRAAIAAAKGEV